MEEAEAAEAVAGKRQQQQQYNLNVLCVRLDGVVSWKSVGFSLNLRKSHREGSIDGD